MEIVRVKYGHVGLQQMHLAAHLLTGERLWILKGFQREVIHNFEGVQPRAFSNSVNGPVISNLFPADGVHEFYEPAGGGSLSENDHDRRTC